MSATLKEYEKMLREAVSKAEKAAPRAVDDLVSCASKGAEAVHKVTGGAAVLELVPVDQREDTTPTYQLQLRKVGSDAPPSDLGIYHLTAAGYPILRYNSRAKWEAKPDKPDKDITNVEEHFRDMMSNPESRLVMFVTFFQQQSAAKK